MTSVVVIGAGHNGLVAAARLARAGASVVVVEANAAVGGMTATRGLFRDFGVDVGAYDIGTFRREIWDELQLDGELEVRELDRVATVLEGPRQPLDLNCATSALAALAPDKSRAQAERFVAELAGAAVEAEGLWSEQATTATMGRFLLAPRLVRFGASSLDELFASSGLPRSVAAGLSALALAGQPMAPRDHGTGLQLLYQLAGGDTDRLRPFRSVVGGAGKLAEALANAARGAGTELVLDDGVARIDVRRGRARGVTLEGGDRLEADWVLSSADPRTTYLGLVGGPSLPPSAIRRFRSWRARASVARFVWALDDLPPSVDPERMKGRLLVAGSLDDLERSADDLRTHRAPIGRCLEIYLPTLLDPSLAPDGQHLAIVTCHHVAAVGSRASQAETLAKLEAKVRVRVERVLPGLEGRVIARRSMTPEDMAIDFGCALGGVMHGDGTQDQMLALRSARGGVEGAAIEGLLLCGSGAHPGGGVTGLPGWLAAGHVLEATGA